VVLDSASAAITNTSAATYSAVSCSVVVADTASVTDDMPGLLMPDSCAVTARAEAAGAATTTALVAAGHAKESARIAGKDAAGQQQAAAAVLAAIAGGSLASALKTAKEKPGDVPPAVTAMAKDESAAREAILKVKRSIENAEAKDVSRVDRSSRRAAAEAFNAQATTMNLTSKQFACEAILKVAAARFEDAQRVARHNREAAQAAFDAKKQMPQMLKSLPACPVITAPKTRLDRRKSSCKAKNVCV